MLPQDMKALVEERIARYSNELETLEPNTKHAVLINSTRSGFTTNQIVIFSVVGAFALLGILLLSALNEQGRRTGSSSTNPVSTTSGKFPGTPEEKAYLEATLRYLTVHYDRCKSSATTMAGAEGGNVTLGEIRTSLYASKAAIDRSWKDDFLPVSNKSVPPKFVDMDRRIRGVHDSQQSAFSELLSYWDDRNNSHITKGAEMFKQSLLECSSTLKELNKILDSFEPKKN
jgi:hypothetical protein